MDISRPDAHGVARESLREVVARRGTAYAAINIALCEDGLYRCATEMRYSHGGFSCPIMMSSPGYRTVAAARTAGREEHLRRWHEPFPSDPKSVRDDLDFMRRDIEAQLQQPALF